MNAKDLVREIKSRFPTSVGSLFKFKKDVEIITLENLEFALDRLIEEGKITVKENKRK